MTNEQCIEVINYLNDHAHCWYTSSMEEEREWSWADIGFLAAWLGFKFEGEEHADTA